MVGPVYHGIVTKNDFVPPTEKKKLDKMITYPVKQDNVASHKYQPPLEKVPTELARCAPVYHDIDAGKSNKYVPAPANKETEKTFKAPIYTGIEVKSKYFPQAEEKPKVDAGLLGPRYKVDSANDYNPEHEVHGRKPHEPQMVGPIYPNIDTCNQYNPKEDRVRGPIELAGPVYHGLETKNEYGPVLKREHEGELMVGPVYHGIQTKNNFVPPKEKGYGEIANCGPVRSHVD